MRHVLIVQAREGASRLMMGGGLHQIQGVCKSEEVEEENLGGSRLWDKSIVQYSQECLFPIN